MNINSRRALSYLLWATMPDDELMALADSGKLHERAILKAQVARMLMDPRSRALFDGFGAQWLGTGRVAGEDLRSCQIPANDRRNALAMYDEVRLLFESIVRENRNVVELIDCDYTFLNENLATIYGLEKNGHWPQDAEGPTVRWQSRGNPGDARHSRGDFIS